VREGFLSTRLVRHRLDPAGRDGLRARIAAVLAAEQSVVFAYLFGSFLDSESFGDVDVAVFLDPSRCPPAAFLDVQLALTSRLEADLRLPADIVILNDAPLGLRLAAIRGQVIYAGTEERRLTFVEQTVLRAMDMAYLRRESLRDLLQPRS
jgi:predicted nucleotidyltransferase